MHSLMFEVVGPHVFFRLLSLLVFFPVFCFIEAISTLSMPPDKPFLRSSEDDGRGEGVPFFTLDTLGFVYLR